MARKFIVSVCECSLAPQYASMVGRAVMELTRDLTVEENLNLIPPDSMTRIKLKSAEPFSDSFFAHFEIQVSCPKYGCRAARVCHVSSMIDQGASPAEYILEDARSCFPLSEIVAKMLDNVVEQKPTFDSL